jgi:hypothetical protein
MTAEIIKAIGAIILVALVSGAFVGAFLFVVSPFLMGNNSPEIMQRFWRRLGVK